VVTPEYALMLGFDPAEFRETNAAWIERLHPEDREPLAKTYRDYIAGLIPEYRVEFRQRMKSGEWKWILSLGRIVERDAEGRSLRMIGTHTDITDRKAAEMALRENQRFLSDVIELSDAVIFVKDAGGRYRLVNRKWEHVTGLSRKEAIGKPDEMLFPERTAGQFRENDLKVLAADTALEADEILEGPRGHRYYRTVKFPLRDHEGRASGVCGMATDVTERKKAEEERERLMAAIEQAGEAVMITDASGILQYVNPAFERVTGYGRLEAIGGTPRLLKSGHQGEAFYRELWKTISSGATWQGRIVNRRKDASLYTEEATISPVRDAAGRIVNYVAVKRDISAQLLLEAQLHQSQKMESVGRLAGGVAHDFNNMLGVILGNTELALARVDPAHAIHGFLEEIRTAAERSVNLTRQLLAFARKQAIAPRALDLNATIEGMLKMIRRLIGEDIELVWLPQTSLGSIHMDPSQIDQILANLCVNARDAIRGNGRITIETADVTLDDAYCSRHRGFVAGDYVLMALSDDGCGMEPDTLAKIFEPFFTTKEAGEGTGLGLATVYGIVKQNGGFVNVYSEQGQGSVFRIYIPRHAAAGDRVSAEKPAEIPRARGETLLVVEDEPSILRLAERILSGLGYRILPASTPEKAIRIASEHDGPIHLLITDVVMPKMNGWQLAERLKVLSPGMRCLFMSGYTNNTVKQRGVLEMGDALLQKPFSVQDLAGRVRSVLDRP
jgi:PAS domain S-box-containing protein